MARRAAALFAIEARGDVMAERRFVLRGEIDLANAPALHSQLYEAIRETDDDVTVDCRSLVFIDSTGAAVLYSIAETLHALGRSLRVVNADHLTESLIGLHGVSQTLRVNDSVDQPN
jgi:anti-anti-sigma factor